jgi:hypothetical protein
VDLGVSEIPPGVFLYIERSEEVLGPRVVLVLTLLDPVGFSGDNISLAALATMISIINGDDVFLFDLLHWEPVG